MSDKRGPDASPTDISPEEVFARISDAVFALDDEWRFTYLNEQAECVLQRNEKDLLGTVVWDAFPEATESTFQHEYAHAMETQEPVKFEEFYSPLDAWFEVRAYPSETGLSVYFRDVTERVRQQKELRRHKRALRRTYEIIADTDQSFSQQIDALLRVVRDAVETDYATLSRVHEAADTYLFETVDVPDDVDLEAGDSVPLAELPNCANVVKTEQTLVLEDVEVQAPELADPTWGISCYLGAPVTVNGEVYGTFCFYGMEARSAEFTDWEVTFVELLSNWVGYELERKLQNDRLNSFAGMLAHELRNPLQIAQLYHPEAVEGKEAAAEEVKNAHDRIEELIDVMLVTARSVDSVIDWKAVELADAATETWSDVSVDEADLVVETDHIIEADPIHLQHLLKNLITNAVEHSGPDVTVRIGDLSTGFYVEDDGPGIPEAERRQVFGAGYTTDADGFGLGLTFIAQLADTYNWECRVTESDAGGARFEFRGVELVDGE